MSEARPDPDGRRRLTERLDAASQAGDADELLQIAAVLAGDGRRWVAMELVQAALSLAPTRPDIHEAVARIYRAIGATGAAERHMALLVRYGQIVDHADELDALADRAQREGDARALVEVASRHARQDRLRPALEACYEALRFAPGDPDVHLQLARIRLALGWHGIAIGDLDRLTRLLELTGDVRGRTKLDAFVATELGAVADGGAFRVPTR